MITSLYTNLRFLIIKSICYWSTYLDKCFLTSREKIILEAIVPFIEAQLDDEGA
mgnify:CR=1 FL=1